MAGLKKSISAVLDGAEKPVLSGGFPANPPPDLSSGRDAHGASHQPMAIPGHQRTHSKVLDEWLKYAAAQPNNITVKPRSITEILAFNPANARAGERLGKGALKSSNLGGQPAYLYQPPRPEVEPSSSSGVSSDMQLFASDGRDSAVVQEFLEWMAKPEVAVAVAAIKALTLVIRQSTSSTMMELEKELRKSVEQLKERDPTSISLAAGCELFIRYVTRTSALDWSDFTTVKQHLIDRGEMFGETSLKARQTIAELGARFVLQGSVVLTHGLSRCALAVLLSAAASGTHFTVVCTEGRPDAIGLKAAKKLSDAGIPVTLILDSAAAYYLERVDLVLVGAEGVVESGGIINKLGSYQIALVAKALNRPFYVAAESYKFARLFPANQRDVPVENKLVKFEAPLPPGVEVENPSRDYTPPDLITLLFTDLGVLTPAAVSDELIQLYL